MAKQYTILLVEDDADIASMFSMVLEQAGFKVEVVETGNETMASLNQSLPDLILLDLVMPDMDGYQVLEIIRNTKKLKQVPVYVFSNLTQDHEKEKALKLGAKDYLIKSDYTPKQLVAKVKQILNITNQV